MMISCKVFGFIGFLITVSINNILYNNYNNKEGLLNPTFPDFKNITLITENVTDIKRNNSNYICSDECGVRDHGPESKFVVNGVEVNPLDWPWLAALYKVTKEGISYYCVGTLITRNKVVTAAHCVVNSSPEKCLVILNRFNTRLWGPNDESVIKEVAGIAIHPSYLTLKGTGADIAVLTLKYKTEHNCKIRPVCIFSSKKYQSYEQHGSVIGWGRNENYESVSSEPRKVDLTIVNSEECKESNDNFKYVNYDYKFCAANDTYGIGPCEGDSGAGFYVKTKTSENKEVWSLRGVVSGSIKLENADVCLDQKYFTFTDMEKQVGWIRDQIEVHNETLTTEEIVPEDQDKISARRNISENCVKELTNSKVFHVQEVKNYNSRLYRTNIVLQTLVSSKELLSQKFKEEHNSTSNLGHILNILLKLKISNSYIPINTITKFAEQFSNKIIKNRLYSIILAEREKGKASLSSGAPYNIEAVKYLIASGADPFAKIDKGENALHYAVIWDRFEVMKYLLQNYNFDIDLQDDGGWTSLAYAVHNRNIKIVKYLIEVYNATCNGYYNQEGYTPLQWAAYGGMFEIVKYLVENCDADVNTKSKNGKTALDLAVSEGFNDIIFYLYYKTSGNHSDIFDTPLHQAVFFNDIPAIRKLLANKFDINARDRRNQTALIWASKTDNLNLFKYLAEVGKANISLSDEHGYTVAHWAAFSGQLNILKYLVDKFKIDLNVLDNKNHTPLHWAAGFGHLNVVKYLVREQKVDTSIRDSTTNLLAIELANVNNMNHVYDWMTKYEAKIKEESSKSKPIFYVVSNEGIILPRREPNK